MVAVPSSMTFGAEPFHIKRFGVIVVSGFYRACAATGFTNCTSDKFPFANSLPHGISGFDHDLSPRFMAFVPVTVKLILSLTVIFSPLGLMISMALAAPRRKLVFDEIKLGIVFCLFAVVAGLHRTILTARLSMSILR